MIEREQFCSFKRICAGTFPVANDEQAAACARHRAGQAAHCPGRRLNGGDDGE
jgi:hypothetical protein